MKTGFAMSVAAWILVGGCTTPAEQAPAPVAVEKAEQTQPIGTRQPQTVDGDLCKARDYQSLVGKNRSEIPVPVDVVNRRVVCMTCPVTQDYSPYRLNIFFNAETDIVELVRCG